MGGAAWSPVTLGELLRPVNRPEPVDPDRMYRLLGAHWYAKGLYVKEVKPGSEIRAAKVFRVEEGDFVYNRLFGWKGSFAVATAADHGCYVSNEFPCFTADRNQLEAAYLKWYFSQPSVWQEALGLSAGGTPTSRNRLKEEKLLGLRVPLPPLAEQRRIVVRLGKLASMVEEARRLSEEVNTSLQGALLGAYKRVVEGAPMAPMANVAPLVRRPVPIDFDCKYYEIGIKSFGKGTFRKAPVDGATLGTKKIFRIEEGDLLFNIVFAWEGAVAVATSEDHGRVGSHRFLTCVPKEGVATLAFLCFHFLTGRGLEQLGNASPGGAGRNRTLGLKALEEIRVPVPFFENQLWFGSLLERAGPLGALQVEAAAGLGALTPSVLERVFNGGV